MARRFQEWGLEKEWGDIDRACGVWVPEDDDEGLNTVPTRRLPPWPPPVWEFWMSMKITDPLSFKLGHRWRVEGLVYWNYCSPHYTIIFHGHKCAGTIQLHAIEEVWDLLIEEELTKVVPEPSEHLWMSIVVTAWTGYAAGTTLCLKGQLKQHALLMLVDSGSLQSVLTSVQSLEPALSVRVATMKTLSCQHQLPVTTWNISGCQFSAKFKFLTVPIVELLLLSATSHRDHFPDSNIWAGLDTSLVNCCQLEFVRNLTNALKAKFLHAIEEGWDLLSLDEGAHVMPETMKKLMMALSAAAWSGTDAVTTLRLHGQIHQHDIVALLDSGSSHTFINGKMRSVLVRPLVTLITVQVTSSQVIACSYQGSSVSYVLNFNCLKTSLAILLWWWYLLSQSQKFSTPKRPLQEACLQFLDYLTFLRTLSI
jgi:hypothetical protein